MARWTCPSCCRDYAYELAECTWCRVALEATAPTCGVVEAIAEVNAGSIGHEDVPYWCALVGAPDGSRVILKLDQPALLGDTVHIGTEPMKHLARVGVLGTGTMGRSLTELLLERGHHVVWCGRDGARLTAARDRLLDRLGRVMDSGQVADASARLVTSTEYAVLGECDLVIEAVVEEFDPKRAVLLEAEASMRADAILATNTSGLPVDGLAEGLARPDRFGVLHFFNPATRMRLVETAVGSKTSAQTAEHLDAFAVSLGKTPVRVAATPAFAVNRALMPLLNEAVRELEEGVAPAESIDEAVRLGLNHPMGPLALIDLIGVDVVVRIMDNLAERTGDATYAPRPLLRELVACGTLGRKTGQGFYTYQPRPSA